MLKSSVLLYSPLFWLSLLRVCSYISLNLAFICIRSFFVYSEFSITETSFIKRSMWWWMVIMCVSWWNISKITEKTMYTQVTSTIYKDIHGTIYWLPEGQTVNRHYYLEVVAQLDNAKCEMKLWQLPSIHCFPSPDFF